MLKKCPNCDIKFSSNNNFCDHCGLELEEIIEPIIIKKNNSSEFQKTNVVKFKDVDKLVLYLILGFNVMLLVGTLVSFMSMNNVVVSLYSKTIFDTLVMAINYTMMRLLLCILSFVLLVNNNLREHIVWKLSYYFIITNVCIIILQFMFILFQF